MGTFIIPLFDMPLSSLDEYNNYTPAFKSYVHQVMYTHTPYDKNVFQLLLYITANS